MYARESENPRLCTETNVITKGGIAEGALSECRPGAATSREDMRASARPKEANVGCGGRGGSHGVVD